MRWSDINDLPCPVAQAMSVIGDSWTVLILRDAMRGAAKFDEFQKSTGASRAIVTERLAHLVDHGVFTRVQYEAHPPRYEYMLTPKGQALRPVMMVLADWGETYMPEKSISLGRRHTSCGHRFRPVIHCSECGESVEPGAVTFDRRRAKETSR